MSSPTSPTSAGSRRSSPRPSCCTNLPPNLLSREAAAYARPIPSSAAAHGTAVVPADERPGRPDGFDHLSGYGTASKSGASLRHLPMQPCKSFISYRNCKADRVATVARGLPTSGRCRSSPCSVLAEHRNNKGPRVHDARGVAPIVQAGGQPGRQPALAEASIAGGQQHRAAVRGAARQVEAGDKGEIGRGPQAHAGGGGRIGHGRSSRGEWKRCNSLLPRRRPSLVQLAGPPLRGTHDERARELSGLTCPHRHGSGTLAISHPSDGGHECIISEETVTVPHLNCRARSGAGMAKGLSCPLRRI